MAKTIKKEDIKEFASDELVEKIKAEELRYKKAKFNHAVSPLDNALSIRWMRRDIARLKTEMRRRELEAKNKKS